MVSFFSFFGWGWRGWGDCHRCLCLWSLTVSLQPSLPLQKKFPCPFGQWWHGTRTFTRSLVTAWTTDINALSAATWTSDAIVALGSRTGHGHQRAPWWQHGSWTSTRLQAGHRPQPSAWILVVTWASARPLWEHRPRIPTWPLTAA